MDKLLPCPFCGGGAEIRYWRKMNSEFMQCGSVGCSKNHTFMEFSDIRTEKRHDTDSEERAIKSWNTRHIPEGYVLVPNEPTETMLDSIVESVCDSIFFDGNDYKESKGKGARFIYKAMITASSEEGE